jgi:hypothetical protein
VGARQVVQLPLKGRQFLQLAQLTDGIVIPPGGTRRAALEQTGSLPQSTVRGPATTSIYWTSLVATGSMPAIISTIPRNPCGYSIAYNG